MIANKAMQVEILYTNWRGETSLRNIVPIEIWYGETEWHKEMQWLLKAIDVKKDAERDFALQEIKGWRQSLKPKL